jgi:hypothetical protein
MKLLKRLKPYTRQCITFILCMALILTLIVLALQLAGVAN